MTQSLPIGRKIFRRLVAALENAGLGSTNLDVVEAPGVGDVTLDFEERISWTADLGRGKYLSLALAKGFSPLDSRVPLAGVRNLSKSIMEAEEHSGVYPSIYAHQFEDVDSRLEVLVGRDRAPCDISPLAEMAFEVYDGGQGIMSGVLAKLSGEGKQVFVSKKEGDFGGVFAKYEPTKAYDLGIFVRDIVSFIKDPESVSIDAALQTAPQIELASLYIFAINRDRNALRFFDYEGQRIPYVVVSTEEIGGRIARVLGNLYFVAGDVATRDYERDIVASHLHYCREIGHFPAMAQELAIADSMGKKAAYTVWRAVEASAHCTPQEKAIP